jgi:centrosomal protein CEP104
MDGVIGSLVDKLSDGAARIRDTSRTGIESIAGCSSIGPATVSSHILKAIPAKQKTAWRPVLGRLHILTDMVNAHGVGGQSGLTAESVMNFAKSVNAFSHSNGEVRDAAKYLTVAVFKIVGQDPLEPYLTELRKAQKEEYLSAFQALSNIGDGAVDAPNPAGGTAAKAPASRANEGDKKGGGGDKGKLKGSVQTTAAKAANKDDASTATANGGPGGDQDFTVCMFCGKRDKSWDEDGLDLHFWNECPLLSPCNACAQIVEIAGLPEHLLDECEHKSSFVACDTTGNSILCIFGDLVVNLCCFAGLAIRKDEFEAWQTSPNCVAPPDNCMYCPLCMASVEDTDDAWRQHLLYGCPKNGRSYAT